VFTAEYKHTTELSTGGHVHYGAPWRGRGAARRQWRGGASGGGGAAGALREEGEGGWLGLVGWLVLPGHSGPGGLARPAWPLRAGWAGSATGPINPKVEEDFFSDKN
jgi:hypothetical protein